jgi:dTDP-4-amino-4,6-dideoxygalactose transaminase
MIKGSVLHFTDEMKSSVSSNVWDVLSSGRLVRDVQVERFEESLKTKFGFSDVALVNSNTTAFDLLFSLLGASGKRVGFLGNAFPSPIFSAVRNNASIRFLDIHPESLEVELADVQNLDFLVITSIGGMVPPNVGDIVESCKSHTVTLIEDAAHSIGAFRGDYRAGNWADASVFSLSATKRLTCGEGGAIVSSDVGLLDEIRCLARYGKATDFGDADCRIAGHSLRFNEIDAAVGNAMLPFFDARTDIRKRVADVYISELSSCNRLHLYDYAGSNWYKFPVFFGEDLFDYDDFSARLEAKGVQLSARIYEIPAYRQLPLQGICDPKRHHVAGAHEFCSRHACLPMHEQLTAEDASLVSKIIKEVLG